MDPPTGTAPWWRSRSVLSRRARASSPRRRRAHHARARHAPRSPSGSSRWERRARLTGSASSGGSRAGSGAGRSTRGHAGAAGRAARPARRGGRRRRGPALAGRGPPSRRLVSGPQGVEVIAGVRVEFSAVASRPLARNAAAQLSKALEAMPGADGLEGTSQDEPPPARVGGVPDRGAARDGRRGPRRQPPGQGGPEGGRDGRRPAHGSRSRSQATSPPRRGPGTGSPQNRGPCADAAARIGRPAWSAEALSRAG